MDQKVAINSIRSNREAITRDKKNVLKIKVDSLRTTKDFPQIIKDD